MFRPLVITAVKDRQLSVALGRSLEGDCWVRALSLSEHQSVTEIARKAEPSVLVVDLEVATNFLDLERVIDPIPFGIVLITARDGNTAVEWLDRGVDSVMKLPLGLEEITAQVFSLARKRSKAVETLSEYIYRDLRMNLAEHSVKVAGTEVKLTSTEYRLLRTLVENAGRVVPHDKLLGTVWGTEYEGDFPLLRSFILRIRKKLGDTGRSQAYIQTKGQLGYGVPASFSGSPETGKVDRTRIDAIRREAQNLKTVSTQTRADSRRLREEYARQRAERAKKRLRDGAIARESVPAITVSMSPALPKQ